MVTKNRFLLIILIIFTSLVLSGCGESQEEIDARSTLIAGEIFETQTAAAPSPTTSPSPTPLSYLVSFFVTGVDGTPIAGAAITLDGLDTREIIKNTNDKGEAYWGVLPEDHISISISAQGYSPEQITKTLTPGINLITVELVRINQEIPPQCAEYPDESICAVIEEGSTIKIGFAGPISGNYSIFGEDISNAGLLAVADAGDFGGFYFELIIEDTRGMAKEGVSAANSFVSDPNIVAIAGHVFSGSSAAAIPIYNQARLPMLSPSATRADLTGGDQDVFHRIPFTDDLQGQFAAKYLFNELGITKLAVMHDGDAYGKNVAEKVKEVFLSLGGEVVALEVIAQGEIDYNAALKNISAFNPEAIYFGGFYPEAAVIAQDMAEVGLESVVLFSDDGVFGQTFIELAGEYAEGVFAASGTPLSSPSVDRFNDHFENVYGYYPGSVSPFTWHGYDVVDALITVIKSVAIIGVDGNLYIPRDRLVQAVNTMEGYEGLTGTFSCNAGECNISGPIFLVVEDGEWVLP